MDSAHLDQAILLLVARAVPYVFNTMAPRSSVRRKLYALSLFPLPPVRLFKMADWWVSAEKGSLPPVEQAKLWALAKMADNFDVKLPVRKLAAGHLVRALSSSGKSCFGATMTGTQGRRMRKARRAARSLSSRPRRRTRWLASRWR